MKRIFSALFALVALTASLFAQTSASGNLSAGLNVISSAPGQLVYLQLTDTSGSANTFIVYDSSSASTTNRVKPSFKKWTYYTTNEVTTYTNPLGRSETVTNTVRARILETVASATIEMGRLYTVTVPASSTIILDPTDGLNYSFGYTIKALGTGSYNTQYVPLQ